MKIWMIGQYWSILRLSLLKMTMNKGGMEGHQATPGTTATEASGTLQPAFLNKTETSLSIHALLKAQNEKINQEAPVFQKKTT